MNLRHRFQKLFLLIILILNVCLFKYKLRPPNLIRFNSDFLKRRSSVPSNNSVIEAAYCSTFNKYKYIATSIISIMKRTHSKVHFNIFFPVIVKDQTNIFDRIQKKYQNCKITFHYLDMAIVDSKFPYKWVDYWHQYMFVRVLMINILTNIDKILYLDTDVYACGDIKEIYDVPLLEKDCLIAGAPDALPNAQWMTDEYMAVMHLNKDTYLNSGVLLMNLKGLREMNFVEKGIEWWKHNEDTRFPDQDMINYLVGPKRRIVLDRKFNKAWYGDFCDCVLRHYNHLKVTDLKVYRGYEDYNYYFESLDEFNCLKSTNNNC